MIEQESAMSAVMQGTRKSNASIMILPNFWKKIRRQL